MKSATLSDSALASLMIWTRKQADCELQSIQDLILPIQRLAHEAKRATHTLHHLHQQIATAMKMDSEWCEWCDRFARAILPAIQQARDATERAFLALDRQYGDSLRACVCIGALATRDRAEGERIQAATWLIWYVQRYAPRYLQRRVLITERQIADVGDHLTVRQVLEVAIYLTIDDISRPQRIRHGRQWLKDCEGKSGLILPSRLIIGDFLRWFLLRVPRAVEVYMSDSAISVPEHDLMSHRPVRRESLTSVSRRKGGHRDPGEAFRALEASQLYAMLSAAMGPQQRQVLELLRDQASPPEIQAEMDIQPGNYRLMQFRIRQQARKLL